MKRGAVKFAKLNAQAPLIVVPVRLNGRGLQRFLLDTGASHSCVTPQLAKRMKLVPKGAGTALGAGGALQLQLAALGSLSVGGLTVKRLTVAIVDLDHVRQLTSRIDGVLGNDFMKRFAVTIDFPNSTVSFA